MYNPKGRDVHNRISFHANKAEGNGYEATYPEEKQYELQNKIVEGARADLGEFI